MKYAGAGMNGGTLQIVQHEVAQGGGIGQRQRGKTGRIAAGPRMAREKIYRTTRCLQQVRQNVHFIIDCRRV